MEILSSLTKRLCCSLLLLAIFQPFFFPFSSYFSFYFFFLRQIMLILSLSACVLVCVRPERSGSNVIFSITVFSLNSAAGQHTSNIRWQTFRHSFFLIFNKISQSWRCSGSTQPINLKLHIILR